MAEARVIQKSSVVLDNNDELKVLERREALKQTLLEETLNRKRPDTSIISTWEEEAKNMSIPDTYFGPHLQFPLTVEQVTDLVKAFKSGISLHYKYVIQLLSEYRKYSWNLPPLIEVEVNPGSRVTVCGDTHGQLQDLYTIFTINGAPSPTNRYLMNGDFVDRGPYSVELVLTLMAYALLYPGEKNTSRGAAVMLNRGKFLSQSIFCCLIMMNYFFYFAFFLVYGLFFFRKS